MVYYNTLSCSIARLSRQTQDLHNIIIFKVMDNGCTLGSHFISYLMCYSKAHTNTTYSVLGKGRVVSDRELPYRMLEVEVQLFSRGRMGLSMP